ncbi:hypothetical protein L596_013221 [Steinernema carpocapsae]|uniref:BTB domain-containing protein n=1 Tax=Steinernema carpocapsae TaxID=34508 RepID=A0A4U5NZN4_STECR|nr:hypothetical protein L596_013221 [Steinernema carpocapsae]
MAHTGVISLEPGKESGPDILIGEFEWQVIADPDGITLTIVCTSSKWSSTAIWNCSAVGTFALASANEKHKESVFHLWNATFDDFGTHSKQEYSKENFSKALAKVGEPCLLRIHIEIVSTFYADLKDSNNALIENSFDAVLFKVDGENLWIPKKVLAAHSLYFATLFENSFKEGDDDVHELENLDLDNFIQFIGIVHSVTEYIGGIVELVEQAVEGLLTLGEQFQCRLVKKRCEESLKDDKNLTPMAKLLLVDRFQLLSIVADVLNEFDVEDLKAIGFNSLSSDVVKEMIVQKLRLAA